MEREKLAERIEFLIGVSGTLDKENDPTGELLEAFCN